MYSKPFFPLLLLAGIALGMPEAGAAQSRGQGRGQIDLGVDVGDGCTVTTEMVNFGLLLGTSGSARSTGRIELSCTPDIGFTISLDRGLNSNGVNRRMYNSATGAYLRYELYSDPAYSQIWRNQRSNTVSGNSGPTGQIDYTVYGEIPVFDATVTGGTYSDTVTVTIEY